MKKTIIFLDIDGVLASYVDMLRVDDEGPKFITEAVESLNLLVDYTGADVCISSAWRVGKSVERLQEILDLKGVICNVVDKTIHGTGDGSRGAEIQLWLDDNPEYEQFIIIDDEMTDIVDVIPYYWKTHIFTNPYRGLDIYDVGRVTRKAWKDMPNFINRTTRKDLGYDK